MFRVASDNSVTTSPPASPPTANLRIPKCPRASPDVHQPDRANPLHCPARQRLIAPHHDSPSIGIPNPCGTRRVIPLRQLATLELAALNISARPAARPATPFTAPDPAMSEVTTCPAHTARSPTMPMPADDGDQYRVAPGSPLPGPASHRPNVDPPRPVNHIQSADFHLDR
jgi:hypothetical protein